MLRTLTAAFTLLVCASGAGAASIASSAHYQATEASLASHPLPQWYDDAKLGIFVHWGLYSVPGYATLETIGFDQAQQDLDKYDWYKRNAYAEWYYNTMLIDGSPTQAYHEAHYGRAFNYYQFSGPFNDASRKWDPTAWARLFAATGARYVVLTTKHHDGFTLWPSAVINTHLPEAERHSQRDIVGELTHAVRDQHMHMGLYYSSVFDWSFLPGPIVRRQDEERLRNGQTEEYVRYADAQWRELIERYSPDLLWSDIGYPPRGRALEVVAEFYNRTPDGVVNDRWAPFKIGDFTTPEYASLNQIGSRKWEETRGIGRSFGLNRQEGDREMISPRDLIHLLVDVVAKNGNLLLDVGPEPDGSIPPLQLERLHALGQWLQANGEAIFGTRPWIRSGDETREGIGLRFTRKGDKVYVILLDRPGGQSVTLMNVPAPRHGHAVLMDGRVALKVQAKGSDLAISLPAKLPGQYAWAIELD